MGAQPGLPGSQFQGEDALVRRIQDLERSVQQLAAANPFAPMGMKPIPGGVEIQGTLSLPAGIINNDALANPISAASSHVDIENFSLATGSSVEKIRSTFTVPAGFTQAQVYATATMNAVNTSASPDTMYVSCLIDGYGTGWQSKTTVVNGTSGNASKSVTRLLTGVGATFYVSAIASSGVNAWPVAPNNGNTIDLSVMVIYLR